MNNIAFWKDLSLMRTVKRIQIDDNGHFCFGRTLLVKDVEQGGLLYKNLFTNAEGVSYTLWQDERILVEPYNQPLVVHYIEHKGSGWKLQMPYHYECEASNDSFYYDFWDRIHGQDALQRPFVLSHKAQSAFLHQATPCEDSDQNILLKKWNIQGAVVSFSPLYSDDEEVGCENFWTQAYLTQKDHWDMEGATPVLTSRHSFWEEHKQSSGVVLGAGASHDAAFLAEQGHHVLALDISKEAVQRGKALYGALPRLVFRQQDAFLMQEAGVFDWVWEHTFFCAISPSKRRDLVKLWSRILKPRGRLMGCFFVMSKRAGPPFGSSEWEIRELLQEDFDILQWERPLDSHPGRLAKELFVLAVKKK